MKKIYDTNTNQAQGHIHNVLLYFYDIEKQNTVTKSKSVVIWVQRAGTALTRNAQEAGVLECSDVLYLDCV